MPEVPTTLAFPDPLPAERRGTGRARHWVVESDGVEVKLTNLDKPYWGTEGYTKGDLVAFWWAIAPTILPYLRDRPLTLKRMPEGADGPFFYAKQVPPGAPEWLRTAPVTSADGGKTIDYCLADDRASLVWLANAGCIELHPWHARVDDIGHPDYAFFDLDPMGAATFEDVREIALLVQTVLDTLGLRGAPRLSGATGMQVFVPIARVHTAAQVRQWVGEVCKLIAAAHPRRTAMEWTIGARGDRIFLDHGMNTEGKNIAATWCPRPERGATVATPVSWGEVRGGIVPQDSTIATVWQRLGADAAFRPVLGGGQDLVAAMHAVGMDPAEDPGGPRHVVGPVRPPRAATPRRASMVRDHAGDLGTYRAKRDFALTPEPADTAPAPAADASRFVIQHHLATRLHHDLRLERGGVAVSWALPKGLPEVPGLRHLAVQTEDHPIAYMTFEGAIPAGEYGGGDVRIWDAGTYEVVEWQDGKVTARLHGRRHTGEYHLFRTGGRDDAAQWMVSAAAPGAPAPPPPPVMAPMLAASAERAFDDDAWQFELKWDGVRAIATCERPGFGAEGSVRYRSRLDNDLTAAYPELGDVWERVLARNAVLDGEVVALGPDGRPSFQLLQHRMHLRDPGAVATARRRSPVTYVVFDVLAVDGIPVIERPLAERMELLDALLVPGRHVVRSDPVVGAGTALYRAATAQGLEGIVAKRRTSRYLPGRRSPEWRKIKVRRRREAVIGGWLIGEGARGGRLGALLVGFHDAEGRLQYAGRVGTGFDEAELVRLGAVLALHAAPASPFADPTRLPVEARPQKGRVRWVRPELVCCVEYGEMTKSGALRAPAYKGLRDGVDPATVRTD